MAVVEELDPETEKTWYRVITVFTVFRLLTDFVCLYNYEFGLSLCKIVRSSVILLLPLYSSIPVTQGSFWWTLYVGVQFRSMID